MRNQRKAPQRGNQGVTSRLQLRRSRRIVNQATRALFQVEALEERRLLAAVVSNSPEVDAVTYSITYHIPEGSTLTTNALTGVLAFDPNNAANYSGSGVFSDFATAGGPDQPLGRSFTGSPPEGTLTSAEPDDGLDGGIDADGSFTYTPPQPDFNDTDTFTAYALPSSNPVLAFSLPDESPDLAEARKAALTPAKRRGPVSPPKGSLVTPTSPIWATDLLVPDEVIHVSIEVGNIPGVTTPFSTVPTTATSPLPSITLEPTSVDTNAFPPYFSAAAQFPAGDNVTVQWMDNLTRPDDFVGTIGASAVGSSTTSVVGASGVIQASTPNLITNPTDSSGNTIDTDGNTIFAVFTDGKTTIQTAPATIGIVNVVGPTQGFTTSEPQGEIQKTSPSVGSSVTLTALAAGPSDTTVQWFSAPVATDGTLGSFSAIPGATSNIYTFTATTVGTFEYEAVFSDSDTTGGSDMIGDTLIPSPHLDGNSANEDTIVAVQPAVPPEMSTDPIIVTLQPTDQTVADEEMYSFTAAATATGEPAPTVVWQSSAPSSPDDFSDILNNATSTSPTFTATASTIENGEEFRAAFTSGAVTEYTNPAILTVAPMPPAITTQPTDQAIIVGGTATFTAAATGFPTPTVQWMMEAPGATSFTPDTTDAGNATDTLTVVPGLAQSGTEYEAVFQNTDDGNGETSTTATTFAMLTVTSPGSLDGSAGTAFPSYNLTTLGTSDWAHWGTASNASAFDDKLTGGSQISDVTEVGAGGYGAYSDPSRTVSWTDGTPELVNTGDQSYIWANNAIGAGYSFTVPASMTKQTIDVYLGGYSSAGTLTATLSDASALPYSVSFSGSSHYSDVVVLTYSAGAAGQHLTLQYVKSGLAGSDGAGGSVDLIAAWLAAPAAPNVTLEPKNTSVAAGATATFTAAATGTPVSTVQWLMSTDGGTTFSAIPGATATTYSFTAAASENNDEYEAEFSNSEGQKMTSPATLTVTSAPSGSLSGVASAAAASYNLTTLGTRDWAHWGLGGHAGNFDDKKTGGGQISNVTPIGSGGYGGYSDASRTTSWMDGMPMTSDGADHGYIWANNAIGAGYSFTVPADTTKRTVYVYLGGYSSGGTLTATLSDSSASPYSMSFTGSSVYSDVVAITYDAGSAAQTLTLKYSKYENFGSDGNAGSVDLIAAWLQ